MTDRIEDGGPAFPQTGEGVVAKWAGLEKTGPKVFPGMTLRDWFAGQALGGTFRDLPALGAAAREAGISPTVYAAKSAYEIADAMLEARK